MKKKFNKLLKSIYFVFLFLIFNIFAINTGISLPTIPNIQILVAEKDTYIYEDPSGIISAYGDDRLYAGSNYGDLVYSLVGFNLSSIKPDWVSIEFQIKILLRHPTNNYGYADLFIWNCTSEWDELEFDMDDFKNQSEKYWDIVNVSEVIGILNVTGSTMIKTNVTEFMHSYQDDVLTFILGDTKDQQNGISTTYAFYSRNDSSMSYRENTPVGFKPQLIITYPDIVNLEQFIIVWIINGSLIVAGLVILIRWFRKKRESQYYSHDLSYKT